jgi:hypothetical protein
MNEQEPLGIPVAPNEPNPYTVIVWRHGVSDVESFTSAADAIEWAFTLKSDGCYVEGVFDPDGYPMKLPWRREDPR